MQLDLAVEQLVQRIRAIEPMSETEAKKIAGYVITVLLVNPSGTPDQTIQELIDLAHEVD